MEENDNVNMNVETFSFFASPIFKINMPEYVDIVREVAEETLEMTPQDEEMDDLYPTKHSMTFHAHSKIDDFSREVIQIAWDALNVQGYNMQKFNTFYDSMWLQEHHKMSAMEQHIHSGIQLVGFYFLDVPLNSSRLILHDPRPGKIQMDLVEQDIKNITFASKMINFEPKVGDLFFIPSWLPHSFSRHGNDEVLKFVHINVGVDYSGQIDQKEGYCTNEPIII